MDLLKQELLKKRQSLAQDTGGKKFFKRSEIQQKEIQKLRQQEKRELEAKSLKRLGLDFLHGNNFPKQFREREKCLRG